ncbi:CRTAC1 family protein [Flagellimonas meishanensis]|uniref:CRTAC1 family protein n=1 Tax=Flagellimonas meishanensis TaxID=2873264 RepID=UPI001CA6A86D|nr:CRTAC1 family protein [[Muricauda] meishanensis]
MIRGIFFLFFASSITAQDLQFKRVPLDGPPQGSRGVSIADLDGDGLLDITVANQVDSTLLLGNTIYFNEGNRFRSQSISENNIKAWSESVHTVDVDSDRDLDLFFTTQFGTHNLLYRNDGTGNFTVMEAGDLTADKTNSPGACWCDYDFDGDMDVFVVNRDGESDNLYLNDGGGNFKRISEGPWINNKGDGRSCAWGDLNGDGFLDLYVANFVVKDENGRVIRKHRNYVYLGTEQGGFVELREGVHIEEENASYGVSLVDFDYDNDLDIYITNVSISDENALYENSGEGHFVKSTKEVAKDVHRPSKGQTWGDFNNDGWLDLYVANGTEGYPEIQNFMFLGRKDFSMERVYNALPAIEGHISAGTASGDLDNDGDLDLYVCNWGAEAEANDCYFNQNPSKNWIVFRLKGLESNTYGIGSWVRLILADGSIVTRYFSRETGYGSENAPEIHFGLGDLKIRKVEILWPSGINQEANGLEANRFYEVIEGKEIKKLTP